MKKLFVSVVTIAAVSAAAFGLTSSFFSDIETSAGNVLQAGAIDLLVSNTSYYNGLPSPNTTWANKNLPGYLFFDFSDLKPSDWGEDTISLTVQNDAWLCMKASLTENDDVSCPEPELTDDPACQEPNSNQFDGELAGLVNFVFWADDGDNVYETGEKVVQEGAAASLFTGAIWPLADSTTSIWTASPTPVLANTPAHIGKYWCFGSLTKAPLPPGNYQVSPSVSGFNCDGSTLNNSSQTDRLLIDVQFTAIQARHNPNYQCLPVTPTPVFTPTPTPTPTSTPIPTPTATPSPTLTPTPTPIACQVTYASEFIAQLSSQGTRKNGTPVLPSRSNGAAALGAPQSSGTPYDNPVIDGSFFSLGFKIGQPAGGQAVLKFAAPFSNQPGPDLHIFEITGGSSYPDEKINVEVSSDGNTWTLVASNVIRDALIDISPAASAQYVRVTDVTDITLFEPTADGYDLDAIKAFCGSQAD